MDVKNLVSLYHDVKTNRRSALNVSAETMNDRISIAFKCRRDLQPTVAKFLTLKDKIPVQKDVKYEHVNVKSYRFF